MKLHWSPRSPFVRKVMIAARELGLADRLDLVRTVAITTQPSPTLMADNPLNKIPTLVLDDGVALFDSRVICEYLDGLGGRPALFPSAGAERWRALRRQALGDGLMDLLVVWRGERARSPELRSAPHLAAYHAKGIAALDLLEAEAGPPPEGPIDIGDISVGCALAYLDFRFADLAWPRGRPRLDAWRRAFDARPSALASRIVDDEDQPITPAP